MTDKEYIRRYTDAADRAQRRGTPSIIPGNPKSRRHMDDFLERFKRTAKGYAEKNVGNMPAGQGRGRAMRRSIQRVRNGGGVLHVQPEAPRGESRLHCDSPLAKVT